MKILFNVSYFLLALITIIPPGIRAEDTTGDDPVSRLHAQAVVGAVFTRLDCEHVGIIETSEVDDHFAQVWLPADVDHSYSLSRAEYSRIHRHVSEEVAQTLFNDADADKNGTIRASELRLHLKRMIKKLDVDGDNEVTRQEAGLTPPKGSGPS